MTKYFLALLALVIGGLMSAMSGGHVMNTMEIICYLLGVFNVFLIQVMMKFSEDK